MLLRDKHVATHSGQSYVTMTLGLRPLCSIQRASALIRDHAPGHLRRSAADHAVPIGPGIFVENPRWGPIRWPQFDFNILRFHMVSEPR